MISAHRDPRVSRAQQARKGHRARPDRRGLKAIRAIPAGDLLCWTFTLRWKLYKRLFLRLVRAMRMALAAASPMISTSMARPPAGSITALCKGRREIKVIRAILVAKAPRGNLANKALLVLMEHLVNLVRTAAIMRPQ